MAKSGGCHLICRPRGRKSSPKKSRLAIQKRYLEEEEWPEGHPHEPIEEFKVRLKRIALSLLADVINKGMGSMKRRCEEVYRTGGEWIKYD